MNVLIAMKSGCYFALVPAAYLHDIEIEQSGTIVTVPDRNGSWPLYHGKTFADAQKFDAVLDDDDNNFAIYEISKYAVKQSAEAEEEKLWEVTFGRTGVAFIKCKKSEIAEKAGLLNESDITWTDDWCVTDTQESDG